MDRFLIRMLGLLLLGSAVTLPTQAMDTATTDNLVVLARAWGLAKYRHPDVTACRRDWDQALLDTIPAVELATSHADLDTAIDDLLDRAGEFPDGGVGDVPAWIDASSLSSATRDRLTRLARVQPDGQCYVTLGAGTRQAEFEVDTAFSRAIDTGDRSVRMLAAFRFWNAIEYFFPYKDDIGRDWAEILAEHLPAIADTTDPVDYALAMRAFTARIEDGHGFFRSLRLSSIEGARYAPFEIRPIEGRPLITRLFSGASGIGLGDEVIAVDGEPLAGVLESKQRVAYGSNPVDREANLLRFVAQTSATLATYRFRRPDGSEYEKTVEMGRSPNDQADGQVLRRDVSPDGACEMAIIDLSVLQVANVGPVIAQIADKDAIVFDVRNYPDVTMWPMVEYFYDSPRSPALFDFPDLADPGTFFLDAFPFGGSRTLASQPRLLLLMDERTQSRAEYTIMGLQAGGNALTFGSQTSAADGNLTRVTLPGDLRASFTGLGVYYPDGRKTQRIGIVPDVAISPSRDGLAAGQDEVLAAALDCRWVTESPAKRAPATGLYWNPERDGEGLDLHNFGDGLALLQYAFDDAGQPIWTLGVGEATSDTQWDTPVSQYTAQRVEQPVAITGSEIGTIGLDVHRGAYRPICAVTDQQQIVARAHMTWALEDTTGQSCQGPLIASSRQPLTGLYNAPTDDGWGISLHQDGDFVFAIAYAYAPTGESRWLVGSTRVSAQPGALDFDLLHVTGYCRTCDPVPTTRTPTGSLRITLPDGADSPGTIQISIDAEFEPGQGRWLRSDLEMQRTVASG